MNSSPNYESYTLEQLFDAQRSIDRERYPERAKEIDLAISKKANDPAEKERQLKLEEDQRYSTFGPRILASIIDAIVIAILSSILVFLGNLSSGAISSVFQFIDVIQFAVYSVALHTLYGQTVGKWIAGVKVVDSKSENQITLKQALLRDCFPLVALTFLLALSVSISIIEPTEVPAWLIYSMTAFGLSYVVWHLLEIFTMLFNEKSRALHDLIAGTVVVRT